MRKYLTLNKLININNRELPVDEIFSKEMEAPNHQEGETAVFPSADEPSTLDIIRTETVLSRLPVHNLAKKGSVDIQILRTTPDGKVDLKWIVSYSDRYGQARQLAYKLDTIVINGRIDEQGRPIPKIICLGSLRDIAEQLDLGGDTNKVRRALRQNASAFITAKFEYRGNDNTKKTLEADFTRYSVVFTGEQLPDGRRADAVYIILNEPYREVLNTAPVRPLDRGYMKTLPPAAQRLYEIVSYKIFSAIKNHYPFAKIAYSEYCTFSAQLRHWERQQVQDQMAKVLRPHKESGYITSVKYEATIDAENKPDWILHLTPGPKAQAEFAVAHGRKVPKQIERAIAEVAVPKIRVAIQPPVEQGSRFDPKLIEEFTRRGITEKKAIELLSNLKPGQDVIAQLEHTDQIVQNSKFPLHNPPGFYIRLIESNSAVPDGFETHAKRLAREERERKDRDRRIAENEREEFEWEYDNFRAQEVDRYIEAHRAEFDAIKDAKFREGSAKSSFMTQTIAKLEAEAEIRKRLTFITFEEFVEQKKQGTDFSLKPVAVSPAVDPVPEAPEPEPTAISAPVVDSSSNRTLLLLPEPTVPEPMMIHLASDPLPPPNEIDGNAAANFA